MPYKKQGFKDNETTLTAAMLEAMEDGIQEAQNAAGIKSVKDGLTVAIIGDSISTHPNYNVSEIVIEEADIGKTLSSYITYYDIGKTISLDGQTSSYTIAASDNGKELTFIPCAEDVGKNLGEPLNYNASTLKTWWLYGAEELGYTPIVASWSGTSITSHMSTEQKAASHAWHDSTIRKLGKRVPGSMERIAPDVVLVYRGTNDQSHSDKVRLTEGYFDSVDWTYPETDKLEDGTYGFKEALSILIHKIRTTYPKARIMLCTCGVFKRGNVSHFPVNNGVFNTPQMNAAIRETADFFGCQTIDLDKCGITFENCYDSGYITDSATTPTHPNQYGHKTLGQQAVSDMLYKLHILDIDPTQMGGEAGGACLSESTAVATNGTYGINAAYFSYIAYPLTGGVKYEIPYARNYCIFDANDTLIKSGTGAGSATFTITAPANASYINVCWKYDDISTDEVQIKDTTLQS
jgi:hypothetical protein